MSIFKWSHAGIFAAGMLAATKGVEVLASKTAHKVYVHTTAAVLRGKDEIMENVTAVREGCEDIYAEAVDYNEQKAAEAEIEAETLVIEDESTAAPDKKKPEKKKAAKEA